MPTDHPNPTDPTPGPRRHAYPAAGGPAVTGTTGSKPGAGEHPGPLAGMRVVEAGTTVATAYAGRLLADLGADVALVEPPAGHPLRSVPPFLDDVPGPDRSAVAAYHHAGKRSINLAGPAPRWLAGADLILTDGSLEPLAGPIAMAAAAGATVVDVSAWGRSGPFAGDPDGDLLVLAASGFLSVASTVSNDPDPLPIRVPGELSQVLSGCCAALTGAAAWLDGRPTSVEIAALEVMAGSLATAYSTAAYTGDVPAHDGVRGVWPWGIFRCRDGGEVLIQITDDAQWRSLVGLLGDPEWGHLDLFATTAGRIEQAEAVASLVTPAMAELDSGWFLDAARRTGVAASLVNDAEQVMAWDQLAERDYLRPITTPGTDRPILAPSAPYRFDGVRPSAVRSLAPRGTDDDTPSWPVRARRDRSPIESGPGSNGAARGPLDTIRVVDLTRVWAGPYAAMHLAHLGAEVIKVEHVGRPDVTRVLGPFADEEPGLDRSGYFNQYNQGKASIGLDLGTSDGRAELAELIRRSDVVIENMRAGALARLGLDDDTLRCLNPRLVTVSLSGFGATGPERDRPAYGSIIDALSGLNSLVGRPGAGPTELPMSLPDPGSGLPCALATVAGLAEARRTGRGVRVDVAMIEAWIAAVPTGVLTRSATGRTAVPVGNRDTGRVPHGVFACSGEYEWVAVAVADDPQFAALASVLGQPELTTDPRFATAADRRRNEAELEAIVERWTTARTPGDAEAALAAHGVPARAVRRLDAVVACPHLAARRFAPSLPHPVVGPRPLPGIPWRAPAWPVEPAGAAPVLGADTDRIRSGILARPVPAHLAVADPSEPTPSTVAAEAPVVAPTGQSTG
ncbi:MAG: CoA transferase [Acidimicrobiales bacterium]